ncbi:hypothetical protein HYX11_00490 [Candidatus Woesearchaeota archaeon]|nr:hypothetical protein [Candidatus Woesearchaeota archaeon]
MNIYVCAKDRKISKIHTKSFYLVSHLHYGPFNELKEDYTFNEMLKNNEIDPSREMQSLSAIAAYIVTNYVNDPLMDKSLNTPYFAIATPLELWFGFVIDTNYIYRKLSEREMHTLQTEILTKLQGK